MTKVIAQKLSYINNLPQKIGWVLLPCLVCVLLLYGFLVRQTIVNVVEREKIGKETRDLLSSISTLEAKYMSAKESVNLTVAYEKGFKDADSPSFINRTPAVAMRTN